MSEPFTIAPDASTEEAVYIALGAASVCWESMDGTGVFDSDQASQIGKELLRHLREQEGTDRGL